MRKIKVTPYEIIVIFSLLFFTISTQANDNFFLLKKSDLEYSKNEIANNNIIYVKAKKNLIKNADEYLSSPLYSVMDKSLVAFSKNKHDYYSFPPYWWPNPSTKDGLPYIRKDGQTNPDSNSNATDKNRLVKMSNAVYELTLAWYFTNDQKYARKAEQQLVTWFINPETKMNPHFEFAQAIPGINNGRGIGLIDSRSLVNVIEAAVILHSTGQLSDKNFQILKIWFGQFYQWMITSQNGFEEDNWPNNHGTYFDLQAVAFAIFSNRPIEEITKRLQITQLRRIGSHFDKEGKQNAELERTKPWHYSNFHLEAYNKLGRLGELTGVDIWNFTLDQHKLENGYQYLATFINTGNVWPYQDIERFDEKKALLNMISAARAYPNNKVFNDKAKYLIEKYPDNIQILMTPIKE